MTETLLPRSPAPSPATADEVALARAVLDGRVAADAPTDALVDVLTSARERLAGLLDVLGQAAGPPP